MAGTDFLAAIASYTFAVIVNRGLILSTGKINRAALDRTVINTNPALNTFAFINSGLSAKAPGDM